ncbi:MAG: KTSC domain-containing protein [Acidobacteria bacterium]|nr:KTSC domain-containing protein [Acidobacteriota bacterium]
MQRHPIESTSIKAVAYDADSQTLEVLFHRYGTFRYSGVPEFLFRGLLLASSKGNYFNRRIKDRFPFEEVR